MSSIIEGYNYDIFISYRQKDNKGDHWVSEFVDALRTELESTFKEEISVYFDINPHDGLLETYDVNASLKEKLKCLIFIPVISRTYCDTKSFAWEHEFKPFIEMASGDQFGLKIKLPNGNYAGRILPVQIHEISQDDRCSIENELRGFLRSIEFIYREHGVNRPLHSKDSDEKNLNRTNFRNQINKVANAIEEIINGMKNKSTFSLKLSDKQVEILKEPEIIRKHIFDFGRVKDINYSRIRLTMVLITLLFAAVFSARQIFRSVPESTIVVLPFQNLSGDLIYDNWQTGIQNELISQISESSSEIVVSPATITNTLIREKGINDYTLLNQNSSRKISGKLKSGFFMSGNIIKSGTDLRINAHLIETSSGTILQSFVQEASSDAVIFNVTDSLARKIKNYLIIRSIEKRDHIDLRRLSRSDDPVTYEHLVMGQSEFTNGNFHDAIKFLSAAVRRDSNLVFEFVRIGRAYLAVNEIDSARFWCHKALLQKGQLPINQQLYIDYLNSFVFGGFPYEWLSIQEHLKDVDENWPDLHYEMGITFISLKRYDEAIREFNKSLQTYRKNGIKTFLISNYTLLGDIYHKTGQYRKAEKIYDQAIRDFPEEVDLFSRRAKISFSQGKINEGENYIEKWQSLISAPETVIALGKGWIYYNGGLIDKAEEKFRYVAQKDSAFIFLQIPLAYLLINKNTDINEGIRILDRAIQSDSTDYSLLQMKGRGLFKQKQYGESYKLLRKSWDIRMKTSLFDPDAYYELMMVKDSAGVL